ncbi:hypothetical protein [Enterococcus sp.]|uniref:hypothetical protein n=1 Tax=Enterococcus sp. TaxID=35783 RepID=UPI002FC9EDC6
MTDIAIGNTKYGFKQRKRVPKRKVQVGETYECNHHKFEGDITIQVIKTLENSVVGKITYCHNSDDDKMQQELLDRIVVSYKCLREV